MPQVHDEHDICPVTGEVHEPDWGTLTLSQDGDGLYVDVTCEDCGRSGCIASEKMLKKMVTW